MKEDFVSEERLNSLHPADKEKYELLTQQIKDEQRKLEVEVPGEPEDRLAVERQIELLEEERQRILL
ncbi:hypothetical protein [Alkalicoccus daliensis]|uniref:Uncharacterized protein n=1 Tax=Alkalicoccus daliensis TaxID=745820 RepID=A0A1H0F308_9BACI|nr:hypothetical protein [Alkalicoccus daliensis]SDN88981.1 hypothetical protein SAMN04488053_104168 [Alkalicoccus daliensis]